MSAKTLIDLYFDIISPYSRIAFESLLRYENYWPIKVNLIPFFLGGILKESGNKPPITVAAKVAYMNKDLRRNADYWGVNLVPPKVLSFIYNVSLRFSCGDVIRLPHRNV
uniref:DSBA domain-containing protein n=1 Tax=Ascaris lumbricoides TaxID=6252 RepID=A0A0M3I5M5_ASCLU